MYAEGAIPQPWLDEVKSGTEEIWKSGDVDIIIIKKHNCADGSILKRETEK